MTKMTSSVALQARAQAPSQQSPALLTAMLGLLAVEEARGRPVPALPRGGLEAWLAVAGGVGWRRQGREGRRRRAAKEKKRAEFARKKAEAEASGCAVL